MEKVNKIIMLLENGQHDEALLNYQDILKFGSNEERFLLAEELFQYGFLEETKDLLERLLQAYPEEGELLVLLAETNLELGNEELAILELEKIKESDTSYPESLLLLADLYQMQGLYEVSEQKILKAKALLPNEVIIDFALGELYFEQGKVSEAIKAYKEVLKVNKEIAGVSVNQRIADALSVSGAFEDALPYYENALSNKLEINTLFGFAFTALQAGFYQIAIEKFTELKELDPEYHSLYLYLSKAYEQEEQLEKSYDTIKEGLLLDEYNKDLFFYGGKLALKLGEECDAEKHLREALAIDPEFTEAALTLNKVLIKQERYEDVLEIISSMDSFENEEPQFLWDAAIAYHRQEEYSQALNKYHQAYTFFKNQTEFLSDYGYFLMEEGKRKEAAEIFNQLIQKDPTNEEYLEVLQRLTD